MSGENHKFDPAYAQIIKTPKAGHHLWGNLRVLAKRDPIPRASNFWELAMANKMFKKIDVGSNCPALITTVWICNLRIG